MDLGRQQLDLEKLRSTLEAHNGAALWRCLEEIAPAQPELDPHEYHLAELERIANGGVSRRSLLKLLGASLALAGVGTLSGCSDKPTDPRIVPYVNPPEQIVAGKPLFIATAMPLNGYARGVLVAIREGRPIKIEGNPDHPASLGGTDALMQASILSLYDPDRAKVVTFGGDVRSWGAFWTDLEKRLQQNRGTGGQGLRILSHPITSPTLAAQRAELLKQFPEARWHEFDPLGSENSADATQQSFGRRLSTRYDFSKADVIVALDSDFLFDQPGSPRYARDFINARRVRRDHKQMNRLYAIESTLSITGSMADHRLPLRASEIADFAAALEAAVSGQTIPGAQYSEWVQPIAQDLLQRRGSSLVIVGEPQPPEVHAIAHRINQTLGNVGVSVIYTDLVQPQQPDAQHSLGALVADLRSGNADTLLILGDNPVYTAAGDSGLAKALADFSTARAPDGSLRNFTAHLSEHEDETSFCCQWHVPESHYLETWSDLCAFDGTASIVQPAMIPLYDTRSVHEILEFVLGRPDRSGYEIIRAYWQSASGAAPGEFEEWWRQTLKAGVVAGSALAAVDPGPPRDAPATNPSTQPASDPNTVEIVFRPDYNVWDGRFSNNAWLQELPRPFTKLVWSNAVLVAPRTAEKLGVSEDDVVRLAVDERHVEGTVLILPGLPEGTATVHLGYGRAHDGAVGSGRGFDAYPLRSQQNRWFATSAKLQRTGRRQHLVTTRSHHAMSELHGYNGDIEKDALKPNAVVTPETPQDERDLRNRTLVRVITLQLYKDNERFFMDFGG